MNPIATRILALFVFRVAGPRRMAIIAGGDRTIMTRVAPSSEERLAESGLLYNLGKSFSSVLDLSELLTRVIDAAVSLTHASDGVILLPDPDRGALLLQAARAPESSGARLIHQPTDDFLGAIAIAQDQPILLTEASQCPHRMRTRRPKGRWLTCP